MDFFLEKNKRACPFIREVRVIRRIHNGFFCFNVIVLYGKGRLNAKSEWLDKYISILIVL